jgi:uncharacterized membrane protein YjfL (UPF0719 family)
MSYALLGALDWNQILKVDQLLATAIWALAGVVILVFAFIVIDKATPGNMWKEIIEEKNTAVALLMGMMAIAVAIIIAAAIHSS